MSTAPSVRRPLWQAAIERLYQLVLHDSRLTLFGIRGLARMVIEEVTGREPTIVEVCALVRDLWEHWHERHDQPSRRFAAANGCRRRPSPVEDMLPSQENAIRVIEDDSDDIS